MQPCEVCGGMGVDAAGYCTQCRNYRGLPAPASGAPYGYAPASPPGYAAGYAAGYAQPPASPAGYAQPAQAPTPGYQPAPMSGPPASYAPTSGGGFPPQPAYAPGFTPPPPKARSFTVPLIALSATLVVLVVAIVVVVIIRASGSSTAKKDDHVVPPVTTTGPTQLVDKCVVGTWEVVDYQEDVAVDQVGKVRVTGKGSTVKLKADGTGVTDYGNGTTFNATMNGHAVRLVATGTITFGYRTSNGSLAFSNVNAAGTETVSIDGVQATSQALEGDTDPTQYTCSGDTLKEFTSLKSIQLNRVSTTA